MAAGGPREIKANQEAFGWKTVSEWPAVTADADNTRLAKTHGGKVGCAQLWELFDHLSQMHSSAYQMHTQESCSCNK